jgi:hypothetical protein
LNKYFGTLFTFKKIPSDEEQHEYLVAFITLFSLNFIKEDLTWEIIDCWQK